MNMKKKYDNMPKDYVPTINSEMSVPSPIQTSIDHESLNHAFAVDQAQTRNQKGVQGGKSAIEFEGYSNSPKIRQKQELDFSLKELDDLVLNNNDPVPKRGDQDYESPHNFLVTL